jgi:hypothetical protein
LTLRRLTGGIGTLVVFKTLDDVFVIGIRVLFLDESGAASTDVGPSGTVYGASDEVVMVAF